MSGNMQGYGKNVEKRRNVNRGKLFATQGKEREQEIFLTNFANFQNVGPEIFFFKKRGNPIQG